MNCGAGAEVLVDKCSACLTCLRVCPFEIPKVTDVARIDSALCQSCGICIAECPANAIVARGWDCRALPEQTADALAEATGGRKKIVAYISGHRASAEEWQGKAEPVPGAVEMYLPSVSRISVSDLLGAFEKGADRVLVLACRKGKDRYPQSTGRIRRRVEQARQLLAEVGMDADRLQLVEVADQGRESIRAVLAEAAAKCAAN
jgi:ferredoxin